MGKVDDITKDYIDDPNVFADIINGYVYDGEQVISAENLKELDPKILSMVENYRIHLIDPHTMSLKEMEEVDMCQALLEIQADAREEGREVALIFLIRKMHKKENSLEEITEMLELDIKYTDNIIHFMDNHPEWDDKQVYEATKVNNE